MSRGLTVFAHVRDEELLMEHWLRHHRRLFDHGVIVDRGSTDRTIELVHELAPGWEVVPSRNPVFDARDCDREMMVHEARHDGWKIVLNATEYLFHDDLAGWLERFEQDHPHVTGIRIPMALMVDPPERRDEPLDAANLVLDRTHGRIPRENRQFTRILHRERDGAYHPGRHGTEHGAADADDLLILRYTWSPHGPQRARKLAIQAAQPLSDLVLGMGSFHASTAEQLDLCHAQEARWAADLFQDETYAALHARVATRATRPPRPARSTLRAVPRPAVPLTVDVIGDDARAAGLAAALAAAPELEVRGTPDGGRADAVVVPAAAACWRYAWAHGLVVVDLRVPPPEEEEEIVPVGVVTVPPAVALLARADFVIAPGARDVEAWSPLLHASGRLDPATAGPEVLAVGDDTTALRAFLADPVRRGQRFGEDRTIEVSERWAGFLYAWAMSMQLRLVTPPR